MKTQTNKSLFDHIKEIRQTKSPAYIKNLSPADLKSFNKFLITRGLSMDRECIEICHVLSKYSSILDENSFYSLASSKTPKSFKFYPWVKNKNQRYSIDLIKIMQKIYNTSLINTVEYLDLYLSNDKGIDDLVETLKRHGYDDKQIEKLICNEK